MGIRKGRYDMTDLRLEGCWIVNPTTEYTTRTIQSDQLGMVMMVSTYTHKAKVPSKHYL